MEAKAPLRLWAVVQDVEDRLLVVHEKIRDLTLAMKKDKQDFSAGLINEEQLAAKAAEAKQERSVWMKEYTRLSMLEPPDFSGITEAERAAEAERLRQEAMEKGRRLLMAGDSAGGYHYQGLARSRVIDFDPKQGGGLYYNRFDAVDFREFDLDEESPLGPMRFTDEVYESESDYCFRISDAVNILSVNIACLDVPFPIHVYGTVVVRDSVDAKCVYHFRRDSHHCQVISSEHESLILTGPKRGIALLDDIYVETDLKIKDYHLGQDRELSKGMISIRGTGRTLRECQVETKSLATRLSTVDVTFALVKCAVEATIAVEVVQGVFYGKITASTTSIQDKLVLYDSKEAADAMAGVDCGAMIQLMRPVISVYLKDLVIIDVQTGDGGPRRILFTPRVSSGEEDKVFVGATVIRVNVAWSVMDP